MISDFGLPIADLIGATAAQPPLPPFAILDSPFAILVFCLIALAPGCLAACLLFADRRDLSCPCGHEQARDVIVHDDAHARQLTQSLTSLCWRCRAAPIRNPQSEIRNISPEVS